MAEEGYRTGNLPDDLDPNDFALHSESDIQVALSDEAAPSDSSSAAPFILLDLPPVYNQLGIGSCTANASCAALRYAHKKFTGKQYNDFEPSRLFAYYYGRIALKPEDLNKTETDAQMQKRTQDGVREDGGANNRRIIHTFLTKGICTESLWPYGSPTSSGSPQLFDTSRIPNPCEPADWGKVSWNARASSHPNDPKALSGEGDTIPRAISYYRIYDKAKTSDAGGNWQIIYNNPGVVLLENTLLNSWPFIFGTRLYKGASLENS